MALLGRGMGSRVWGLRPQNSNSRTPAPNPQTLLPAPLTHRDLSSADFSTCGGLGIIAIASPGWPRGMGIDLSDRNIMVAGVTPNAADTRVRWPDRLPSCSRWLRQGEGARAGCGTPARFRRVPPRNPIGRAP